MKQPRHQARTVALQGLYQLDMQRQGTDADMAEILAPLLDEAQLQGETADYAQQLTNGTWAQYERYDQIIGSASEHWDVARMAVVDRNILRLALYELTEQPNVPARVVIDEAIELGREFGAAETSQFINGVLDAIWKHDPTCRAARLTNEHVQAEGKARNEDDHGTL